MKKSIFMFALITGALFISCKSNSEKEADAIENVVQASEDLNKVNEEVKQDNVTKANDKEWQEYKKEAYKTISENETRIADLQKTMKKPGKKFDDAYQKSIESLVEKNTALKTKITNYEDNQGDWNTFKTEFKSDMDGLGKAFKDLGTINKK